MATTSLASDTVGPPPPSRLRALGYWVVVGAWMLLISQLSGAPFSAENTNRYLDPILRYLFPDITAAGFSLAHTVIRKTAHFSEFFVLGGLTYWAVRRGRQPAWQTGCALRALAISAAWALADEAQQAFVPNRTASLADSAIDTAGALAALFLLYLWKRARRTTPE